MKDRDVDTILSEHLSVDSPQEAFKQQALRDSTAALVCLQRRRSAWRRAEIAAAAVLIAGFGFLGGRLSMPHTLPSSVDVTPQAAAESDGVTVPSDLVAWLDAARLFKRLNMEERMARAFEHASELTPYYASVSSGTTRHAFADNVDDKVLDNQNKHSILAEILGPHESVKNVSGIIAQSFGDYYYENKMD